jgi:hypothetical protein
MYAVVQLVEALRYKPQSCGFHPDEVIVIFHWLTLSGHIIALRLTQPLTNMGTRNIDWGIKAMGA